MLSNHKVWSWTDLEIATALFNLPFLSNECAETPLLHSSITHFLSPSSEFVWVSSTQQNELNFIFKCIFFGVKEGTQPQKDRTSYRSNKGPRPPLHLLTKKRELWWGRWQLVQNPREEYAPISKIICNNVGFPYKC